MLDYSEKILLAFRETFSGYEESFKWLMNNGCSELAALSNSMRGNQDAALAGIDHSVREKIKS